MQAPYVKPADVPSFLQYSYCLFNSIEVHHKLEETHFFPEVERIAEKPGLMEENVAQHHAFYDSMYAMRDWIQECIDGKETYDAVRMRELIDVFAPVLRTHLSDEIDTLEKLRELGLERWKELPAVITKEANDSVVSSDCKTWKSSDTDNVMLACTWYALWHPGHVHRHGQDIREWHLGRWVMRSLAARLISGI